MFLFKILLLLLTNFIEGFLPKNSISKVFLSDVRNKFNKLLINYFLCTLDFN